MAAQSDLRFTFSAGTGNDTFDVVECHLIEGLSETLRLDTGLSGRSEARKAGLSRHEDLHDYVFLALASGTESLGSDRSWSMVLGAAVAGKGRLGDLYLTYRRQQA